jgi:hypothetical protein
MYSLYIMFSHNLCIYKNINVWTSYSNSIIYIRLFEIKILKKNPIKTENKTKGIKIKGPY